MGDSYIVYRNLNKSLFMFLYETHLFFSVRKRYNKNMLKVLVGKVSFMKEWTKYQTFGMVAAAIALCILMLQIGAPL